VNEIQQRIDNEFDSPGIIHEIKSIFGFDKPLVPTELLNQKSELLGKISDEYEHLQIGNMSAYEKAFVADTFATLPKGATFTDKNVGKILGQLSDAQKDAALSFDERTGLSAAYANVYARANVEGVMHGELTSDIMRYNVFGSATAGGASLGTPIPLVQTATTSGPSTVSEFVPFNWRNSGDGPTNSAGYQQLKNQLNNENISNIAEKDPRLAAALNLSQKNDSIGKATADESAQLGQIWVGDGATAVSFPGAFLSADGTRLYRPPQSKPSSSFATTGVQSNFIVVGPDGKWITNGHLNITP
jgi:hypothetical protein